MGDGDVRAVADTTSRLREKAADRRFRVHDGHSRRAGRVAIAPDAPEALPM